MFKRRTATEVQVSILVLPDEMASGDEVLITRHGHVVACLIPASEPNSLKGTLAGVAMTAGDEEDLFTTGVV